MTAVAVFVIVIIVILQFLLPCNEEYEVPLLHKFKMIESI